MPILAIVRCALLVGLLVQSAGNAVAASDSHFEGRLVAFSSASAFAVLDAHEKLHRIKLFGIDAPELSQPYGEDARRLSAQWLSGQILRIQIGRTDREGRVFGQVLIDGTDIALRLIEAGLAWCDPADADSLPPEVRDRYWGACATAKTQRMGLWRDAFPKPPWEHRKIPQFKPLPVPGATAERTCRFVGTSDVHCDDGITYRLRGDRIYGSDGVVYLRYGNALSGSDGTHARIEGQTIRGPDGTVCRIRGRLIQCN